jgi:hypothetical protein
MRTQRRHRRRWIAALGGLAASLAIGGTLVATAAARTAAPPRNVTPPGINGTAKEGSLLTATNGTWENTPTSFTYQ